MNFPRFCVFSLIMLSSCAKGGGTNVQASPGASSSKRIEAALRNAAIPEAFAQKILGFNEAIFLSALEAATTGDAYLHLLVDKKHPLIPLGYAPADLVELHNGTYQVSRAGLMLRRDAEKALAAMAAAAQADGVTLTASSAYRSYKYQVEVYARNVRENGQAAADRESARPGYSQHQTGLAVDFGSITDAFAGTAAGKWMAVNAPRFGWSISFPDGYEAVTGYRWESWHFRYVGIPLAEFITVWFAGIQQYALQFIYEWERLEGGGNG
ncbi:MAG: M15 family metallopeptidase [Spirochaetaceae bacterium]|jgi:D-alanyl-D-alanine carboxypeptidase|nr:M15 family metallopeptidase [Spirochaetaceae bacterium]